MKFFGITELPKTALALALSCVMIISTSCSLTQATTVVSDIQKFLPAVTNVLAAVCAFESDPLCASGAAQFETAANNAIAIAQAYLTAAKAGTATPAMWNELNAAFITLENQAANIFALVHVSDPTIQLEIEALVASAQALLAVIESLEPAAPMGASHAKANRFAQYMPQGVSASNKTWLKNWKKSYNSLVDASTAVKAKAKLKHVN